MINSNFYTVVVLFYCQCSITFCNKLFWTCFPDWKARMNPWRVAAPVKPWWTLQGVCPSSLTCVKPRPICSALCWRPVKEAPWWAAPLMWVLLVLPSVKVVRSLRSVYNIFITKRSGLGLFHYTVKLIFQLLKVMKWKHIWFPWRPRTFKFQH